MTDEEKTILLRAVLNTLDTIPVAGHDNQCKMYNCVEAIKQILGEIPGNEVNNGG